MFESIPTISKPSDIMGDAEYNELLHSVTQMGHELDTLELLSVSLNAGASPELLFKTPAYHDGLSALLGADPLVLSLEELREKIDEEKEKSKAVFWVKRKKAILASLAAATVAIGGAIAAIGKLKSRSADSSPTTTPNSQSPSRPSPAENLPVVAGRRRSHNLLDPGKVTYGESNPGVHRGTTAQAVERRRMGTTLLPYLRNLAKDVHEQAYKSQSALAHIRTAQMIDVEDLGSDKACALEETEGHKGFDRNARQGKRYGIRSHETIDREEKVSTILGWIEQDLGYIRKNAQTIPNTLKTSPPSVSDRLSSLVKAYLPTLKTFSESLDTKISTLSDIQTAATKAQLS